MPTGLLSRALYCPRFSWSLLLVEMVSFSCEGCGDVLTKKKLDPHRNQCRGASFTCLDCMTWFHGTDYRSHTSCISEAQKYQGHLYRPEKDNQNKKAKTEKRKSMNGSQAMVPKGAYVEDAPEGDDMNTVAVVDVPPRAPTPPPAPEALPGSVNVFDFLVSDATPKGAVQAPDERKMLEESQYSQYSQYSNGNGSRYLQHGFSYGNAPLQPEFQRYDSWNSMANMVHDSQDSQNLMPPPYTTPAPKEHKKEKKDKRTGEKRKRNVDDLDLSSVKRPVSRDQPMSEAPRIGGRALHSGLTGGLQRLVTDNDFYEDRIEAGPTPISPSKRSKREKEAKDGAAEKEAKKERRKSSYVKSWNDTASKAPSSRRDRSRSPISDRHRRSRRDDSASSEDRSRVSRRKAIDYPDRPGSVQPTASNTMTVFKSRADHFMSLVNKGPESERGISINKALKRFHRDRDALRSDEKEDEDKELWKSLRMRRNSRGEIVLFQER